MEEMLFLQKEKVLKVKVLEKVSEHTHERFKLEVLRNLSGHVQTGTIFEVNRRKGKASENDLFGDIKFERFILI